MIRLTLAASAVAILSACASSPTMTAFSQTNLPDAVKVPAGHKVALESVGIGQITYECRAKKDTTGFEWVFVGPDAKLMARGGKQIGKYFGPPATWESADGSKITGTQLATAPAAAGNIPLQLVKANPAMGNGAMTGVGYIQRVDTRGGVAPSKTCDAGMVSVKEIVNYQADYVFWKAV